MTDIQCSPAIYQDLLSVARPVQRESELFGQSIGSFGGMQIQISTVFPITNGCGFCHGSGEGEQSTYCERCDGAGSTIIDGMMRNGAQTNLFRRSLPKAFAPYFPKIGMPARRLCRGLP